MSGLASRFAKISIPLNQWNDFLLPWFWHIWQISPDFTLTLSPRAINQSEVGKLLGPEYPSLLQKYFMVDFKVKNVEEKIITEEIDLSFCVNLCRQKSPKKRNKINSMVKLCKNIVRATGKCWIMKGNHASLVGGWLLANYTRQTCTQPMPL